MGRVKLEVQLDPTCKLPALGLILDTMSHVLGCGWGPKPIGPEYYTYGLNSGTKSYFQYTIIL